MRIVNSMIFYHLFYFRFFLFFPSLSLISILFPSFAPWFWSPSITCSLESGQSPKSLPLANSPNKWSHPPCGGAWTCGAARWATTDNGVLLLCHQGFCSFQTTNNRGQVLSLSYFSLNCAFCSIVVLTAAVVVQATSENQFSALRIMSQWLMRGY